MKTPIQLYFIPWAVYDNYKEMFQAGNRDGLTPTRLTFWAHYIVAGDDRILKKIRTDEFAHGQALTKSELAMLIRYFDGLVMVK